MLLRLKFNVCFNVTVNCKRSIAILGMDELSDEEKTLVGRARRIQFFLFSKTLTLLNSLQVDQVLMFQLLKPFVALKKSLKVNMTIFQKILCGSVGPIEDVVTKAKAMGY